MRTMRKLYWLYLLVALLGLARPPAAHAVALAFQPASQTFNSGDTVLVNMEVTDLGSEIVAAYDLDVTYEATVLKPLGVAFYPYLGDILSLEVIESSNLLPSVVDLAAVSLLSDTDLATRQAPLGGTVRLARIAFEALASGDTSSLSFAAGSEVKGANNQVILTVNVPEPSTMLLLGAGLAAPFVLGRKKTKTW